MELAISGPASHVEGTGLFFSREVWLIVISLGSGRQGDNGLRGCASGQLAWRTSAKNGNMTSPARGPIGPWPPS
jgi:hypothetical protein